MTEAAIADGTPCPKCGCTEHYYRAMVPAGGNALIAGAEVEGHCLSCGYGGDEPFKGRGPMGQKPAKAAKDPAYLKRVRGLRCCICDGFGEAQNSPTQAHHPIHGRGGNLKTPDRMAIPLCEGHHQGDFDTSKIALHREPDMWREAYGIDREYVAATQDRLGV